MSGNDEDDSSEFDILQIAHEEARRTIDYQAQTLNDIDSKAARILRLNLILLSIVLTGGSIVASGDLSTSDAAQQLENTFVLFGLSSILVSTAVAALTYTSSTMRHGMSGRDLRKMLANDYTDRKNMIGLLKSYSTWAQFNFKVNTRNAPLGTLTVIFLTYGIVFLAVGVFHALVSPVTAPLFGVVVAALVVFTWRTGIVGQLLRYWKYRNLDASQD